MKRLVFIGLICCSSMLFARTDIDIRVHDNFRNGYSHVKYKNDNYRHHKKYKHFNYRRHGYYDNRGYYFGYFDKIGYVFNNIFYKYNNKYTYYDRLYQRGFFRPNHHHFRKYLYKKRTHNRYHRR